MSRSELKRDQMRPDEGTHMLAQHKAFEECARTTTIEDLGSEGVGRSGQGELSPVSERHDEALGEALALDHNLESME